MAENKEKKTKRRTLTGKISKISGEKTVKVRVEQKYPHPKYGKIIMKHKSYLVHDAGKVKDIKVGDIVIISECTPVSKMKKWELTDKLK